MTKFRTLILIGAIAGAARPVLANTEPPSAYDARSVGMGSTGVAHVENGASLYHNPAALDGIERGAITGVISPLAPQLSAPLTQPGVEEDSKRTVGPLFLVGGAYRVHERLTLGVGVFPTMGFGAVHPDVDAMNGLDLSARLMVMEIAPGASFAITDWLAVGLAYRISYMSFSMETPVFVPDPPPGALVASEAKLSGWNFTGLHAGVYARLGETTRLGLSYRSKVTGDLEGDTEMGPQKLDTSLEFSVPHIFKVGVAQALLQDRLLLALDLRYALFKDANEALTIKSKVPGVGEVEEERKLDWQDSIGAYLGGEFRFAPAAVRAGYSVVKSATSKEFAQPILPPPGLQHTIHAGAGVSLADKLDLDLGGYYLFGGKYAERDPDDPESTTVNGHYGFNAILVSLSATYRFGAKPAEAADEPPAPPTASTP